jgi:hypothetical protein
LLPAVEKKLRVNVTRIDEKIIFDNHTQ